LGATLQPHGGVPAVQPHHFPPLLAL